MTGRIVERSSRGRIRGWFAGAVTAIVALMAGTVGWIQWSGPPIYEVVVPPYSLPAVADAKRGRELVGMLCWSCHFDPTTGALSGRALAPRLANFGDVRSANITGDDATGIGSWSAAELANALRVGVHPKTGAYIPPSMPKLARIAGDDLGDIVAFLRSDDPWLKPVVNPQAASTPDFRNKLLARLRWSPPAADLGPPEAPSSEDPDAYGAYLVNDLHQCFRCHSRDTANIDYGEPASTPGYLAGGAKLFDESGRFVHAPNLTPDKSGIGGWSFTDFRAALVTGRSPSGDALRWPMPRYEALGEREVEAIFVYLQSVQATQNAVAQAEPYRGVAAILEPGKFEFYRHACQTCHPETGEGLGALDQLVDHFPNDKVLAAFIRAPRSQRPSSQMPRFEMKDDALANLITYLRERGD